MMGAPNHNGVQVVEPKSEQSSRLFLEVETYCVSTHLSDGITAGLNEGGEGRHAR